MSNSQGQILANFNKANSSFGTNHYPFDDGTVNNGKHKFVDMPQLVAAPLTSAGEMALYTKAGTAGTSLFMIRDNIPATEVQLTSSSVVNVSNTLTTGFTWLPGGIFMQWGQVATPGSSGVVVFPVPFDNIPVSIQVTLERGSGNQSVTVDDGTGSNPAPTASQFAYLSSSGGSTLLFWLAIGKKV